MIVVLVPGCSTPDLILQTHRIWLVLSCPTPALILQTHIIGLLYITTVAVDSHIYLIASLIGIITSQKFWNLL